MPTSSVRAVLRDVGRLVQQARVRADLTQEEAASRAGIDYKRWQRLEKGEVNPTLRTLVRVAAALGLPFWDLVKKK